MEKKYLFNDCSDRDFYGEARALTILVNSLYDEYEFWMNADDQADYLNVIKHFIRIYERG